MIKQTCKKIDTQEILDRKFYPVWFFTNERAVNFLLKIKKEEDIQRAFCVGGGGDFVFNLLSIFNDVKRVDVCDTRQLANITIDFKNGMIKEIPSKKIINALKNYKLSNKEQIYNKVREKIAPESVKIFDNIFQKSTQRNLFNSLRKSGYWYKDSFWQFKDKKNYLFYLEPRNYEMVRRRVEAVNILCGDFNDNLKLFENESYDLIYTSNIFDSGEYCSKEDEYLSVIKSKLEKSGLLIVVVQFNVKKKIERIEKNGFKLWRKELHRFNIINSFLGHYSYSFLAFKKL